MGSRPSSPGAPFTRDRYEIAVGSVSVQLKNGIDASASTDPKGLEGDAVGDDKAVVTTAIDRTSYSDSVKNVLKGA